MNQHHAILFLLLHLVLWIPIHLSRAEDVSYTQYTLAPPPVEYNGSMTLGPSCNPQDNIVACTINGLLGNGPPTSLDLDVSTVHAWDEDVDIVFTTATTTATTRVRQVNLYFHHDPSQRIGLPFVELYWSDIDPLIPANYLRYTIVGNQDLSESDTRLRNVSLVVITPEGEQPLHRYLRVHFTFNTTVPVDWVLLSEVQLCSDSVDFQLEPISFEGGVTEVMVEAGNFTTTSIDLSCTVSNDGYFQWEWTFPSSSVQSQIQLSEASRTSTAQISNMGSPLSVAFEGEYTCRASYRVGTDVTAPTPAERSQRTITLKFERELEQVEDMVTVSEDDPTATLGCELWGYVTSDEITWAISGEVLENDTMFTITTEEGSRLLKVGDNPPRPSIRSILTIHELISQPTLYIYFCSSPDFSMVPRVVSLIVEKSTVTPSTTTSPEDTPSTTTPPTPPGSSSVSSTTQSPLPPTSSSSSSSGGDIGLLIGAVVGALAFGIIVVVSVIVILCYLKWKQRQKHYHFTDSDSKDPTTSEPFYSEVNKPMPPPLPSRFYYTGAYATIDTTRSGNGNIELVDMNENRASISSAPDGIPMPVKLKHHPDFLQNNPLYLSADHLNRSENLPPIGKRSGSVPVLDTIDSGNEDDRLNIYAEPSRVPPPLPPPLSSPPSAPLYSEALTPALFRHERQAQSPPEDDLHPYSSIYDDPTPLLRSEGPLEVKPNSIREVRSLGMGQFGQVILAETVGLSLKDLKLSDTNEDRSFSVLVAAKMLKVNPDKAVKEAFEKEVKFMSRLDHQNVVRLLAVCLTGTPFIVMEYMQNGDLNQYLRNREFAPPDQPREDHQLPASILLYMAMQIASGMSYLASFRFIHRDLATRNCLVGHNNIVKIADFGMSRSLYSSYYYRIRGRAMLPIRWMANECFYGKFSEKTDVWAFGVIMWEVFTFAKKQPYEGMSDQEVIDDAVRGEDRQILPQPEHCPPEIYEVMLRCFVHEPSERADFEEVHSSLAAIHAYSDIP